MTLTRFSVSNFDLIYRYFVNELTAIEIEVKLVSSAADDWVPKSIFGLMRLRTKVSQT